MTLQRYLANDMVLHNYKIPAKVGPRSTASQMEEKGEQASAPGGDGGDGGFCLSLSSGCWAIGGIPSSNSLVCVKGSGGDHGE